MHELNDLSDFYHHRIFSFIYSHLGMISFQTKLTFFLNLSRGMTVSSGTVLIKKDQTNLIGISIGGGAPLCPCLFIVQVMKDFKNHFLKLKYFFSNNFNHITGI